MTATGPRAEITALLTRARDLSGAAASDADVTMASVSHACRMGLDAIRGTGAGHPTLASFGEPGRRRQKWIIHYQDAEVGSVVYDAALYGDAEAELLAREHYERASVQWNCTLLRIAALDPAQEDRHRVRAEALEASLRTLRDLLAETNRPDTAAAIAAADALIRTNEGADG